MKLLYGYVIKVWIPNLLIIAAVIIKYFMENKDHSFSFKRDFTYPLWITLLMLFIWDLIALYSHGEGLWYIGKYALAKYSPIALFISIIILVKSDSILNKILALLFLSGLMMAVNTELRYLSGDASFETLITMHGDVYEEYDKASAVNLAYSQSIYRHGEEVLGQNTYAAMLIPLPLIGFYLGQRSSKILLKWYYYLSSTFLFYAIIATISRAAFIALVIGILVMIFLEGRKSSKIKSLIILAFFCLIIFYILSYQIGLLVRLLQMIAALPMFSESQFVLNKLYDLGYRGKEFSDPHIERIGSSFGLFKENPFFGVGWPRQYEVNEHNHYIQQTVIYGLISSFIYIIFLAIMVSKIFGVLGKTLRYNSSGASLGVLLFASTIAYLTYLNAAPGESPYCWILFGLTLAWSRYTYYSSKSTMTNL